MTCINTNPKSVVTAGAWGMQWTRKGAHWLHLHILKLKMCVCMYHLSVISVIITKKVVVKVTHWDPGRIYYRVVDICFNVIHFIFMR